MLGEVRADAGVQLLERQRVPGAGADVVVLRLAQLGLGRHHRADRADDVVDRDDLDHRVRRLAGNSGSSPRPYARISGSAILKPSIQPGCGLWSADSMMAGRTIDVGSFAGELLHHTLAERLGEGVAVGPAEAAGALGAGLDQPLRDPFGTPPLGVGRGGQVTGAPVQLLGLLAELGQHRGGAGLLLDPGLHRHPGLGLGAPVDEVVDRGLRDRAAAAAGRVGGGDVHVVDRRARSRRSARAGSWCRARWS